MKKLLPLLLFILLMGVGCQKKELARTSHQETVYSKTFLNPDYVKKYDAWKKKMEKYFDCWDDYYEKRKKCYFDENGEKKSLFGHQLPQAPLFSFESLFKENDLTDWEKKDLLKQGYSTSTVTVYD